MNVLLTSSGRRTYLVDYFKQALEGKGLVFASNSAMSPALVRADGYGISPLIYSEEYIPWILSFAKEHSIGLIVPLFDIDLPVLAKNRAMFEAEGIVLAVSSLETVETASDKYAMYNKLTAAGIGCPAAVLRVDEAAALQREVPDPREAACHRFRPMILKPRFGMGSLGLFTAEDEEELAVLYRKCLRKVRSSYLKYESAACSGDAVLIQELISGEEYGLDVISDFQGEYQTTVVRQKIGMRSGETDEAVILGPGDAEYDVLSALGERLAQVFEIHGNMDVDVIMDPAEQKPYVIDINARFGGGYPFSHAAGVDLPRAYAAWAEGRKADPAWLKAQPGVHGYKDIEIRVYP